MSSFKRPFYIFCSMVLGSLLGLLLHAGVEIIVIAAIAASSDARPYGLSWDQWFTMHAVWTVITYGGGAACGYFLGVRWWQWVYVEKRHWRMRQVK